jgi:hypothetical protein
MSFFGEPEAHVAGTCANQRAQVRCRAGDSVDAARDYEGL